ncbi:MAG: hypothetical protein L0287_09525, partial [Anaerolineae bacterium]|nr:hypothetical protein [Anaerolineae bacterium]
MQESFELLTNNSLYNRVTSYGPPSPQEIRYHILAVVLVGFILSGCQSRQDAAVEQVTVQQISSPFGDYNAVAWLTSDQLVVQFEPEILQQKWTNLLWVMQIDGSNLHALNLPKDEQTKCEAIFFTSPTSLPDGRLAFERDCHKLGLDSTDRQLLVWDPNTDTSHLLYNYELPVGNALFTFAPDLSRGLMSSHTAIEDKLFWLDTLDAREVSVEMVRANKPAWSPDG